MATTKGRWWRFAVVLLALLIGAVWLARNRPDTQQFTQALQALGGPALAAGLLACLASLLLRAWRWQQLLGALGHGLPPRLHLRVYFAGLAMGWTPGKLGETLRSVLLRPHGVPVPHSLACFLAERLGDVLGVALLGLLAARLSGDPLPWMEGLWALAAAASLLLAALGRRGPAWLGGLMRWPALARVQSVLEVWAGLWRPRRAAWVMAVAMLSFGLQGLLFGSFALQLAPELPLLACVSWFALSLFVGAASMVPHGLGAAEAAMVLLLVEHQVPASQALAIALSTRLCTLGLASLLGWLCLLSFARPSTSAFEPRA